MEYRVTKYDPKNRDRFGRYLRLAEWTCFSDIGESVTQQEYLLTEEAYIDSAIAMLLETNCEGLFICGLEERESPVQFQEGNFVTPSELKDLFQVVLRGLVWCKFENRSHFVHFGYDFYMYVGTPEACVQSIDLAINRGLYVEEFQSPYLDSNR